ncbi:MAG TPA: hypothetical protein VG456_05135 [Candidatus Sulfopaludibacter sp.]|jgi:hypothetical protein|nr:hypothetical protein [Candidatus Sulfopaludibacter sp.]
MDCGYLRRFTIGLLCLGAAAFGADLCPAGARESGTQPGVLAWSSYRGEVNRKQCAGSEIRNTSGAPLDVSWTAAGMEQVHVQDRVEMAVCCFDGERSQKTVLHYGSPAKEVEALLWAPAEEGLENNEEGYPDLIEGDARVRTVTIRGTLRAGGETVRVDLLLKCSASKFAKQFAYQFSITDRSADAVDVDWDLLRQLRASVAPSVQPIPNGKTYIFLSEATPRESDAVVEVRTKAGAVAGRFRFGGFTATAAH